MKVLNRSINVEDAHMSTYNTPSGGGSAAAEQPSSRNNNNKTDLRKQLASQLSGSGSGKHCSVLKKQSYVSRPTKNGGGTVGQANGGQSNGGPKSGGQSNGGPKSGGQANGGAHNHAFDPVCMMHVFRYLTPGELARCALVCRSWSAISQEPALWRKLDVTGKRLTAACLAGVVKRQPEVLLMNWTAIAKRQLEWMITKLTRLKELSLQGCSWSGVTALRSNVVPPSLTVLDLSFVTGMNDASLRDILSPPPDSRSSSNETTRSRFRNLRTLKLAGVDVGDVSLRYVVQYVPNLTELDLAQCYRITDAGIAQLTSPVASAVSTLQSLDLSGCKEVTDASLDHLLKCTALKRLDLKRTPKVTATAINRFLLANKRFSTTDTRLLLAKSDGELPRRKDDDVDDEDEDDE